MYSAFGVDHGEISKKQKPATPGRLATGGVFSGWHGAAAGRKGHKLRAVGNEVGGGVLGGLVGAKLAGASGAGIGSIGGGALGTQAAQRKGHYKSQKGV